MKRREKEEEGGKEGLNPSTREGWDPDISENGGL
jgi:hypothetical protein